MYLKLTIFLFLKLSFFSFTFSQNTYDIKGTVKTADGQLPSGNALIYSPADTSLIKGTFFINGHFLIQDIQDSTILLLLSSLEFDDLYLPVSSNHQSLIDLGEIVVSKSGISLNELTVTGRRPVYTQRADGTLEILVENTMLSASNSVLELLGKSPDIILDEDGNVNVFGKGAAIIYVNGQRISENQLSTIQPANIKKLEVIRNPSAKYDAEGAAVINITTIKRSGEGYQVNLKQNTTYSNFAGMDSYTTAGLQLNKGRFSANLSYAFGQGKYRHNLHTTRDRNPEDIFLKTDLLTEWQQALNQQSYFDVGLQYAKDRNTYVSLEYSGFVEPLGGHQISTNRITDEEGISDYESDILMDERDLNHSLSLNYHKTLDSLGSTLFFGGQYSFFNSNGNNLISEKSIEYGNPSSRWLRNDQNLDIYLLSGQLDYQKKWHPDQILESGIRFSHINNNYGLDFLTSPTASDFQLNDSLSNDFRYQESVAAAYLSFKTKWSEKINSTIGLRSEYTNYRLDLSRLAGQAIADQYIHFFPNLSVNLKWSERQSFNFSYTSRITRAPYERLNPILRYQDPYTNIQGNPELQPQKIHSLELGTKVGQTVLKFGYSYFKDPFGGGALRGNTPKSYILIRLNYDNKQELFTSASRTFHTKWWTSTNTVSLKYTDINETTFGYENVGSRPQLYFYSNNRFQVGKLFNLEAVFAYQGDEYEEIFYREKNYSFSLAIDRSFWQDQLNVRLLANDIFNTNQAAGRYNLANTEIYFKRKWTSQYFRLSLSYNFGRLKKGDFRNKEVGEAERERI